MVCRGRHRLEGKEPGAHEQEDANPPHGRGSISTVSAHSVARASSAGRRVAQHDHRLVRQRHEHDQQWNRRRRQQRHQGRVERRAIKGRGRRAASGGMRPAASMSAPAGQHTGQGRHPQMNRRKKADVAGRRDPTATGRSGELCARASGSRARRATPPAASGATDRMVAVHDSRWANLVYAATARPWR